MVSPGQMGNLEKRAIKDLTELQEKKASGETLVLMVLRVSLVPEDFQAHRVPLDLQDLKETMVQLVNKDALETPEEEEYLELTEKEEM